MYIPNLFQNACFILSIIAILERLKTRNRAGYYSLLNVPASQKLSCLKTCILKNIGYIIKLFIFWVFILLSGCMLKKPTPEQASCLADCQIKLEQCHRVCDNSCPTCSSCATKAASLDFKKYKHRQCVQGTMSARELQSYRDPLKCKKITCNCMADYKICVQSCYGVIHKRLQVAPTCC